ncbi:SAF domain-containing protein (plasmid) [Streptomyces sp. Q6]|uniref:SAF domain-containing protein n=1 Tax=Streptomyces citrinus TaxID=3118173 RepID=A0ACD5AW15_9ACTN
MSRTDVPAQAAAPQAQVVAPRAGAQARWQVRRRRPGMLAAAVACIAVCVAGNWWYWTQNGERQQVLELARDVPAGHVIKDRDLQAASVALDPSMKVVGVQQRGEVVGMRAVSTLRAGALLHPQEVTRRSLVKAGEQKVRIALKSGQMPQLKPADTVQVVFTGDVASSSGAAKSEDPSNPQTVTVRVVWVGAAPESSGEQVVDVAVDKAQGPKLAAQAAAGDVALAVNGAGG